MSNICYVVLNPEQKNRKKNFKNFFWPTYGHFLITYFYCHFENLQSNWLGQSSWNFQDRQKGGFEDCSENFVPIWHLWPILEANKGRDWQQKYVLRTLSLYRPVKLAIGVRSGRNFVYTFQIHPFDDPEKFSVMGLASLTVLFQPLSPCKIGHRCQIRTKSCIQHSKFQLDRSSQFGCSFSKW